jgi:hypothetical protein
LKLWNSRLKHDGGRRYIHLCIDAGLSLRAPELLPELIKRARWKLLRLARHRRAHQAGCKVKAKNGPAMHDKPARNFDWH